nr:MAG TPA: hypothetical protein [Caudoviricetes sp.]DAQ25879.1 MAG TPA: hypothetical protein [Caudoviricetes sp.]
MEVKPHKTPFNIKRNICAGRLTYIKANIL